MNPDGQKDQNEERHLLMSHRSLKSFWQFDIDVKIFQIDEESLLGTRTEDDLSPWTKIKRGVGQGRVLPPDIFSLYSEAIPGNTKEEEEMKVGGKNMNNNRYAGDTDLIVDSEEELQYLISIISVVHVACAESGLQRTRTITMSHHA